MGKSYERVLQVEREALRRELDAALRVLRQASSIRENGAIRAWLAEHDKPTDTQQGGTQGRGE